MVAGATKTPVRAYGPAQLPSSSATRYTVPADRIAVLRHIHVINPTAGAITITVSIGTDAAGTRLFSGKSLAAGAEYDHLGYWVLGPTEFLQANASSGASVVMSVFGDEYGDYADSGANDRTQTTGSNDATSSQTVVTATASASTNTKGAWSELVASTAHRTRKLTIQIFGVGSSGVNTATLVDIGVGAAASEVVKIADIVVGGTLSITGMPFRFDFQLDIAAGSRIAVRLQGATGSQTASVGIRYFANGGPGPSAVTTYGARSGTSDGTSPTTPGAINTEGGWAQITAGTSEDHGSCSLSLGAPPTATSAAASGLMDIGYGGAGAETVLIANIPWNVSTTEDIRYTGPAISRINLPTGTRLACRIQATAIAGTFRPNVAVHCWGALTT